MSTPRRRTKRPWWRRRRNRPLVILAAAGVLVGLVFLIEAASLLLAFRDLSAGAAELAAGRAALGSSPEEWDGPHIQAAQVHARAADERIGGARRRVAGDVALKVASALPGTAPTARAVLDLASAAGAGSSAFFDILDVARVFAGAHDSTAPAVERYLKVARAAQPPFARADAKLGPAVSRLAADQSASLPGPVREQVDRVVATLGPVATQARIGSVTGDYLPDALGSAGERTYLLLLENPGELRPGGGFAGNVGTITFRNGNPVAVDVHPNSDFWPLIKDRFPVPYPLGNYLGFYDNNFDIGDVAWDPDFPTDAVLAERIYKSATGRQVDGTISIDPYAIAAFLEVTGPVDVPGYGTFSSSDFFDKLQFIVNVRSGGAGEKDALGRVAPVILSRLIAAPLSSWPRSVVIFGDQVRGRHVQLYLHDPRLAAAARAGDADGRLLDQGSGDYLLVDDGNVGATKGDLYIKKVAKLKTEVHPGGLIRHQLDLLYDMPLPVDQADVVLNPGDGAYVDYLRVYLPGNASLASIEVTLDGKPGGGSLDRVTVEHGAVVVAVAIRVPRGHRVEVNMYYQAAVPATYHYDMLWQKQAGIPGLAASVDISTPGGRRQLPLTLRTDQRVAADW